MSALPRSLVRDVITAMSMCGKYNAAGECAYDVGVPAKSGISGDTLVAVLNYFGGAFFSPGLVAHGNSVRGVGICRDLSTCFGCTPTPIPKRPVRPHGGR